MRQVSTFLTLVVLFGLASFANSAAAQTVTDAEIQQAINALTKRLYAAQNKDGLWNDAWAKDDSIHGVQWGGVTALCTYALLQSGESFQNPKLKNSLKFLRSSDLPGTYARAMRAHVWAALPDTYSQYFAKDVRWLADAKQEGPAGGYVFTYWQTKKGKGGSYSNSRTKFGLLGLWEGAKRGHTVPYGVWSGIEEHYTKTQNKDGGWGYNNKQWGHSRGSMTAAGLIAQHVILDYHHRSEFRSPGKRIAIQNSIDKGLKWFDKNFVPDSVPETGGKKGGYSNVFYYLYAMERVGLASGVKYFNGRPWFESGARVIVKQTNGGKLNPGRQINSKFRNSNSVNEIISMAFALIFLSRGSSPVMVNKLEIPDYSWNNRPNDVDKLAKWMSESMETHVLWQRAPISTSPDTWHDAPMLYLAGHKALNITDAQKQKIKKYINGGGILITVADGGSKEFSASIRQTMEEIFPRYKYAPVKEDDPLMSAMHQLGSSRLKTESLNNGVRHMALHFPTDVSWTLHREEFGNKDVWNTFANVYYYATGGWPRSRLQPLVFEKVTRGPDVQIARIKHDGNWNPEPLAWREQNRFLGTRATARTKDVTLAELPTSGVRFAHMAGTGDIELNDADVAGISAYVKEGGVLLIENAGGVGTFTETMTKSLESHFTDKQVIPIEVDTPIITGEGIKGYDISRATYRKFTILRGAVSHRPRLMELYLGEKGAIFISSEDITSGMLGRPAWGINGYSVETARKLMANFVFHAMAGEGIPIGKPGRGNKSATRPVTKKPEPDRTEPKKPRKKKKKKK